MKNLFTMKQSDLDRAVGQALGTDQPASPEIIQRDITGRIIDNSPKSQGKECPECEQPDLYHEGEGYWECYNCGHHYKGCESK